MRLTRTSRRTCWSVCVGLLLLSMHPSAETLPSRFDQLTQEILRSRVGFDGRVVLPDEFGVDRIYRKELAYREDGTLFMRTTLTLCAAGCTYTVSAANLQTALDAATNGDSVLLQRGVTVTTNTGAGTGLLPTKAACVGDTCYSIFATGVEADGTLIPEGDFPDPGVRPTPADETLYAKLTPAVNEDPALRTEFLTQCPSTPNCVPHHWRVRRLAFISNAYGGQNIVQFGRYDWGAGSADDQDTKAKVPHDFLFEQNFVRGNPVTGQHRCTVFSVRQFTVSDNYIKDCKTRQNDGQGILIANTQGPGRVINNYVEGSTENIITYGVDPAMRYLSTVQSGATTTTIPLDTVLDLEPKQWARFAIGAIPITSCTVASPTVCTTGVHNLTTGKRVVMWGHVGSTPALNGTTEYHVTVIDSTHVSLRDRKNENNITVTTGGTGGFFGLPWMTQVTPTWVAGTPTITVAPALPSAPAAGSPVRYSTQPTGIQWLSNLFEKPLAWFDPIVPTITGVTATPFLTGGSLADGDYYFYVTGRHYAAPGETAESTRSTPALCTIVAGLGAGRCQVAWNAGANITAPNTGSYRLYAGTVSGTSTGYFTVAAGTTTYSYTASTPGTAGQPPTLGTRWGVKNSGEMKACIDCLVRGNKFLRTWTQAQPGNSPLVSVVNDDGRNPSAVIRDTIWEYNDIESTPGGFALSTDDYGACTGQMSDIIIRHNLIRDVNTAWGNLLPSWFITGGASRCLIKDIAAKRITIDHNTVIRTNGGNALYFNLWDPRHTTVEDMKYTNNLDRNNVCATISGAKHCSGTPAWEAATSGTRTWGGNILQGVPCANYPPGTICISLEADWQALFVNYAGANFRCAAGQPCFNAAISGYAHIGADIDTLLAETAVALSGDNSGDAIDITTSPTLPSAMTGVAYSTSLSAIHGLAPLTWSLESGTLPTGLTLSAAGVISGTPTAAGQFAPVIRVTDSTAGTPETDVQTFGLTSTASGAEALTVTPATLPIAYRRFSYSTPIDATGGTAGYTWSVASGTLPAGVTLHTGTGVLSGIPTALGTYSFSIRATDAVAVTDTEPFVIYVLESRPERVGLDERFIYANAEEPTPALGYEPRPGDLWYETDTGIYRRRTLTNAWNILDDESTPGATTLAELTDVAITAPTADQTLTYDAVAGKFVNTTPATPPGQPTSAWLKGGNALTTADYLGSTNDVEVRLGTNGVPRLRIEAGNGAVVVQPGGIGNTDPVFYVTNSDSGNSFSQGFSTSNGRRVIARMMGGSFQSEWGMADATAATDTIFGIVTTVDGGSTWLQPWAVTGAGTMKVKWLTLVTGTRPTCAAGIRGQFWYVAGGAGVKDSVEVCAKSAGDVYDWRVIY